jgi:tetratricopeptide (TPR) repeat protein
LQDVYYEKAITINLLFVDVLSPTLNASYQNLGNIYLIKGNYTKSLIFLEKALEIQEKIYDEPNLDICNMIGICYFKLKNYGQAYKYYTKTLELAQKDEEQNYIYISSSYNNLAKLYVAQKEYKKAFPLYQKTIAMEENSSNPNPRIFINYGDYFYQVNDLENAKKYYLRAIEILEPNVDDNHPELREAKNNLEKVNLKLKLNL